MSDGRAPNRAAMRFRPLPRRSRRYRRLVTVLPPGTLDGGDVMRADRSIYIGVSTRTNVEGIRQFAEAVAPFGYCCAVGRGERLPALEVSGHRRGG